MEIRSGQPSRRFQRAAAEVLFGFLDHFRREDGGRRWARPSAYIALPGHVRRHQAPVFERRVTGGAVGGRAAAGPACRPGVQRVFQRVFNATRGQ